MARKRRIFGDTGIYHVILRGNNQESLFYNDLDRIFFLKKLNKYILELNMDLYAYCLMGNHVHLLIGKGNELMPLLIKKLTCSYVYYFNHKYERTGHLFQGRYKSEPVETVEYFKIVYRYIIKNPEKANICVYYQYRWNSFALIDKKESFINNDYVKKVFESVSGIYAYLKYQDEDLCMEDISEMNSGDDDIKSQFIKQLFNVKSPNALIRDSEDKIKENMYLLKLMGLSINQISRLTGISKYLIRTA